MTGLPPKADIGTQPRYVRFVPIADISEQFKNLARAGEVRQPLYVSFVTVGRELISSSR